MSLAHRLSAAVPAERVSTRYFDRIAWANDASVYRLVPSAVVWPMNEHEVRRLLDLSRRERIPLTFRAAGTSLSGQAVTDGILAVLSRGWRDYEILDDGARIRLQPGVIGGLANQVLRPHGRKIGPDPASINACMIGGILANNSSGMCCGVEHNAYHTLDSMRLVLPDGTVVDTAPNGHEPAAGGLPEELAAGIAQLRDDVRSDELLSSTIRRKYRLKNTMGYSLNAFLDHDDPAEILTHLMIGSEGTLGFVAEAVLRTVPDYPFKYTGLLFFDDVPAACSTIDALKQSGARALELMDGPSLRAVQSQPGVPARVRTLPDGAAALLVEYQCKDEADRDAHRLACDRLLPSLPVRGEGEWTVDPDRQAALWRVRKGLIPSVGAMRARGTSFIIEDVVFPVDRLAEGVEELQGLFARWAYDDAIVFGHAKDGNLHFVLTQSFGDPRDVERYDGFMHDLAGLVAVRHGGALKAEHGTGRNMAPFVATEWGAAAVAIMRRLKTLIDPDGLLNPGVILNDNPAAHVTHLKDLPDVESEVDRCIECGFCERWCPSRDLTLTPRQRIVVRREMQRLQRSDPHGERLVGLKAAWPYEAEETCATDGLCASACPVSIDTGELTKRLRRESVDEGQERFSLWAVERFEWIERMARTALRLARAARLGHGLPPPADGMRPRSAENIDAVLFASCVSRVVGEPGHREPPGARIERVAARAGLKVWTPHEAAGLCCGMPFSSKGLVAAHRSAVNRTVAAMWDWSREGRFPVVIDASPCAWTLKQAAPMLTTDNRKKFKRLTLLDGIEFAHDELLDRLEIDVLDESVALHAVCSVRKMGLESRLNDVVAACAREVTVPVSGGCCGMAGDRGYRFPELPRAALAPLIHELAVLDCDTFASSSASCESGLSHVTGKPYRSFWSLLDRATGVMIGS